MFAVMPRPKNADPLVPIPVRIPASLLAKLRAGAASADMPLAGHVRWLLDFSARTTGELDQPAIDALADRVVMMVENERSRSRVPTTLIGERTDRIARRMKADVAAESCQCGKRRVPTPYGVCKTCGHR